MSGRFRGCSIEEMMAPPTTRRDLLKWSVSVPLLAMSEDSTAQRPTITATTTAILADPVYKQHDPGAGHPERPERYDAVTQALSAAGLMNPAARIKPRFATEDEIALCHSHAYIQKVKQEIGAGARQLSTGDTDVGPRSFEVALQATGGIL